MTLTGGQRPGGLGAWQGLSSPQRRRVAAIVAYVILLTLLFMTPLTRLLRYAAGSDLHSHILLIPFISGYLLLSQRRALPTPERGSVAGTVVFAAVGLAALAAGVGWREGLSENDSRALITLSFLALLWAGGFLFLGSRWMAAAAFPVAFLIFLVPLPNAAVAWLERASAVASAEAAALYFAISGTSLVRHGTVFELPGIALEVAQECSGIRSSWILVITSLLASHLFLKSPWRRLVLVAFVIPLGILRNGFRVFVIGLLCVHVGPHMVDSVIHRRGGPFFFALSLIPLFMLLWWLRRGERRAGAPRHVEAKASTYIPTSTT